MTLRNMDPLPQRYLKIPYDYYCPSVQKNLSKMCCKRCGLYHATQVAVRSHECEVSRELGEEELDEMDDSVEFQTELSPKLPEASLEGPEVVEDLAWWIRSDYVIVEVHEDKED